MFPQDRTDWTREECIINMAATKNDIARHEHGRHYTYIQWLEDNCKFDDPYAEYAKTGKPRSVRKLVQWMEENSKKDNPWRSYMVFHDEEMRELHQALLEWEAMLEKLTEHEPLTPEEHRDINTPYNMADDKYHVGYEEEEEFTEEELAFRLF